MATTKNLILAVICVLLVIEHHSKAFARALENQDLPTLILDDAGKEDGASSKVDTSTRYETNAADNSPKSEVSTDVAESTTASKESQETTTASQPKEDVTPAAASSTTTSAPISGEKENTTEKGESPVQPTLNSEKDINSLFANKNDAENDLASPDLTPKIGSIEKESSPKKTQEELDTPVDLAKDDRTLYTVGQNAPVDKPSEDLSPKKIPEAEKKDEESPLDAKKDVPVAPEEPANSPKESELTTSRPRDDESTTSKPEPSTTKQDLDSSPVATESKGPAESTPTSRSEAPTTNPPETTTTSTTTASPATKVEAAESLDGKKEAKPEESKPAESPKSEADSPNKQPATTVAPVELTSTKSNPKEDDNKTPLASIPAIVAGSALGTAIANSMTGKNQPGSTTAAPVSSSSPAPSTTAAPSSTRKSVTNRWDRWDSNSGVSTSQAPSTRRRPILPSIRRRFRPYNRFSPFPWGGADSYIPYGSDGDQSSGGDSSSTTTNAPKPSTVTLKPRRASSTTMKPLSKTSTSTAGDSTPTSSSRRGAGGVPNNKRRHNHNHHHDSDYPYGSEGTTTRRRQNNNNHHNNRHHHHHHHSGGYNPFGESEFGFDRPSYGGGDYPSLFSGPRPAIPGLGLFNTGSTGSGFDLLNPFSWLDEATRPRPARGPSVSAGTPSTIGSPGRLPGRKPEPFEGDYSDRDGEEYPNRHHHDRHHHRHHHRPDGRDDYYDDHHHDHHHHDCHHDRDRDRDEDYDYHHQRPRPQRPRLPGRDEPHRPSIGDIYPPVGGSYDRPSRPGRPYDRREPTPKSDSASPSSSPAAAPSSHESEGSQFETSHPTVSSTNGSSHRVGGSAGPSMYGPSLTGPRRVPSLFSPFESLFGSLDDDLFGMRSTFTGTFHNPTLHTGDTETVITSPKISMPDRKPLPGVELVPKSNSPETTNKKVDPASTSLEVESSNAKLKIDENPSEVQKAPESPESKVIPQPQESVPTRHLVATRLHSASSLTPCAFPESGLLCLLVNKPSPVMELLRRF